MTEDAARELLHAVLAWRRGVGDDARTAIEPLVEDAIKAAGGSARVALDHNLREHAPTILDGPGADGPLLLEPLDAAGARYTIDRLHSSGGLGQVWIARDATLGRQVAFKEIRAEHADNPVIFARFLREARITGNLEHPGIVPVYELARHPETGRPFYTMRFVRGITFTQAIADFHRKRHAGSLSPLDLPALLGSLLGVANAIGYAHARGIIHRDLKGDNVILGDFGETIVLDWGIAKRIEESDEEEGQILGTPGFMAPEQASGHVHAVGPRTDVHGLGAILYEILTGQPPFSGKDTAESMRRVIQETPAKPRSIWPEAPAALEAICLKALSKDPEARYAGAPALAEEIRRFLADEPVSVWREPFAKRSARWARRHRTMVAAAVVLVVASLVALVVGNLLLGAKQKEIERQRAQTEANYRLAKGAVDRYLTTVADSPELKAKGLEKLRTDLFGSARGFYETLIGERGTDPGARADLGSANLFLGNIAHQTGESDRAEEAYGKAIDLFETLAREHPEVPEYRSDLIAAVGNLALVFSETGRGAEAEKGYRRAIAFVEGTPGGEEGDARYLEGISNVYDNLGTLLLAQRRMDEGEAAYVKALAARERLQAGAPEDERYRKLLLTSHVNLSSLYASSGRETKAEPHLAKAAEIGEALLTAHPDDPEIATGLAATYNNLGGVDTLLGRLADARKAHEKAMALRERLAAEHPSMIDYQLYLAGSCVNVGELAVRNGDPEGALPNLDRADAVLGEVLAREPRHADARFYAAYSASWRARALDASGHLREGERAWKRAASLNDRGYPTIPAGYARALARRRDFKHALEQARAVEEAEQLPGEVLYDLAATYSLAAAADPKLRDAHAARAMRLLEQARDLGFFQIPGALERAAADSDLRALERLPGWEKLVSGVPSSP